MNCRFCDTQLKHIFVSLGVSPLSNSYVEEKNMNKMEPFYPLESYVCEKCFLVQLGKYETPENIFSDYAYFSSYSDTWLSHCENYVNKAIDFLKLGKTSFVAEIASNDGYLLQYFLAKNIPVLGIEPARNVAKFAIDKGIATETVFFGTQTAVGLSKKYGQADLIIGNNVLAHVPELNDFVSGLKLFLKPEGVITMEFPHLLNLYEQVQFDTIYHEHFSYFSFLAVSKIFEHHGLKIFDVERLATHGGSLRIYACNLDNVKYCLTDSVNRLIDEEKEKGYSTLDLYINFGDKVKSLKRKILNFMIDVKEQGKTIAGYGAPAKGNTLLNYCGIKTDFMDYTVDKNPHKQGKFLPGSRIPIKSPEFIKETKPDYLFILPWNIKDEIIDQTGFIKKWGGKHVTAIPELEII